MSDRCAVRTSVVFVVFFFSVLVPPSLTAANVSIPSLELVTRGYEDDALQIFALATYGEIDLAFDGGTKFGGRVEFSFADQLLELPLSGLTLKELSFTINELFTLPMSFSWFLGQNDTFCNGDDFSRVFGSPLIATHYRGFMYFPTGVIYDGIYTVKGTGARIDFTPKKKTLLFSLFAYQDSHFSVMTPIPLAVLGIYSADFRALMDLGAVKMEAFAGATYSPLFVDTLGIYRGGFLFYAAAGETAEFLAEIGVPRYDPANTPVFTFNQIYILLEPRVHLGFFSIVPTFFLHPGVYEQLPTSEGVSFDINLDLFVGNVDAYGFRAGIESKMNVASATSAFNFVESPYVSFVSFGLQWDLKVDVLLKIPFSLSDLSGMIGIRAEF
jgi:hypothetical protein